MTTEQDIKNQIDFGRFEGKQEGLQEGIAKGKLEKAMEIARKMIETGIPLEQVVSITGLTEEDIMSKR